MAQRNARGGGARGNVDPIVMEMLRGIAAQLELFEMAQRRGRHVEDVSNDEEEVEVGEEG